MAPGFGISIIKVDSEVFVHLVHDQIDIIFPLLFFSRGLFSRFIEQGNGVPRGKSQDCEQTSPL